MPLDAKWKQYWGTKKKQRQEQIAAGVVDIYCLSASQGLRFNVVAPYKDAFVLCASSFNGRWRPKSSMWTFKLTVAADVIMACRDLYGKQAVKVTGFRGIYSHLNTSS